MRSILERLLLVFTPLLTAATSPKKLKTRPAARATVKAKKQPARRKAPAPAPKGKAKIAARGARGRAKAESPAPKATSKTKPATPFVKPPPPIGRAILLAPENGKYADSVVPKFRWLSVGGANRYDVVWSEEPNFSGARSTTSLATEAAVPADHPLRVGATYYWRVRGGNEGGWGPWSLAYSFQVLEAPPAS